MADPAYTLIHMMEAERLLAARLIAEASAEFSCRGCNDMPKEMFEGMSAEVRESMLGRLREWGSGLDHMKFEQVPDWLWLSYFAAKIKGRLL